MRLAGCALERSLPSSDDRHRALTQGHGMALCVAGECEWVRGGGGSQRQASSREQLWGSLETSKFSNHNNLVPVGFRGSGANEGAHLHQKVREINSSLASFRMQPNWVILPSFPNRDRVHLTIPNRADLHRGLPGDQPLVIKGLSRRGALPTQLPWGQAPTPSKRAHSADGAK